jgi:pseudouridine-5'-phosphate glycosidase
VDLIDVREDIRAALADGRPVAALESSVIAHGLPSPVNVRVAHSLEDAVRVAGAIPATVGVIAVWSFYWRLVRLFWSFIC